MRISSVTQEFPRAFGLYVNHWTLTLASTFAGRDANLQVFFGRQKVVFTQRKYILFRPLFVFLIIYFYYDLNPPVNLLKSY